jgi:hypothetical protein
MDTMSETPRIIARVSNYQELIEAMRRWFVRDLNLPYSSVDGLAGLPDGHAGKLFAPVPFARIGSKTLGPLLAAGGLRLHLVVDDEALERIRNHRDFRVRSARAPYRRRHSDPSIRASRMRAPTSGSFSGETGRIAQARWMLATKAKQRSRWARAAALARWGR